ncbi:MAG: hypothetical protein ABIP51_23035 [Bacteroidia bacterium]
MIKQNPKDQKPVQKTKEGKVSAETTHPKSIKNLKADFASSFNNPDANNNLVYLYW